MKITYYGHACWGVEIGGKNLLFDPFISPNPLAKHIDIASVKADYILITHGHEDHVADALFIAQKTGATIVSNFEIVNWFMKQGHEKIHPMNIGGKWKFDFGSVTYFSATHSSSMPDGSYGGNPGSFIIESSEGNFYHAGDTGLMSDMKLIPLITKLDFAMLPIGDNFTMDTHQAVLASDFIQCDEILAMHFDTFGYIVVNKEVAVETFKKVGKKLHFVEIGQTINR
ncbi:MAG: metal-dependent hydrolase [Bacteroidales bacterium]|nr:metal-dependent hydrolase [Bacteroidales bacterium]